MEWVDMTTQVRLYLGLGFRPLLDLISPPLLGVLLERDPAGVGYRYPPEWLMSVSALESQAFASALASKVLPYLGLPASKTPATALTAAGVSIRTCACSLQPPCLPLP